MARSSPINLRKAPRQSRAQATVDAILQATAYILAKHGWAELTTNGIAERAGVNIASLYQYFPNKLAVVAELRRRARDHLGCSAPPSGPRTLRETIEDSVSAIVREYQANPELQRAFAEELPRAARRRLDPPAEVPTTGWEGHHGVPDLELAGFIVRAAARGVVHEVAAEHPEWLAQPRLVSELSTMLERYLVRDAPAAKVRRAASRRRG